MKCISCKANPIVEKEWKYRNNYYQVVLYRCPKCSYKFKGYYHNGTLSHTIPKLSKEIVDVLYVLKSGEYSGFYISKKLDLSLAQVNKAIYTLKKARLIDNRFSLK